MTSSWAGRGAGQPLSLRGCRLALAHPRVLTIATEEAEADRLPSLQLAAGPAAPIGGLNAGLGPASAAEWRQRRQGEPQPWERIRSWPQALDALTAAPPRRPGWYCFLPARAALPLTLRAWQPGDRLELGEGSKKVGDVFTDAKVPAGFRGVWAVLADAAGALLWVPGLADGRLMQLGAGEPPAYVVSLRESG
jgi:tRNA(Ile)-lysidine synthetase-like protein